MVIADGMGEGLVVGYDDATYEYDKESVSE